MTDDLQAGQTRIVRQKVMNTPDGLMWLTDEHLAESDDPLDPTKDLIAIPYNELYEIYSLLEDATTAQSVGDPNTCAKKAAKAKRELMRVHNEYRYDD